MGRDHLQPPPPPAKLHIEGASRLAAGHAEVHPLDREDGQAYQQRIAVVARPAQQGGPGNGLHVESSREVAEKILTSDVMLLDLL
jgi:hypothetical protein